MVQKAVSFIVAIIFTMAVGVLAGRMIAQSWDVYLFSAAAILTFFAFVFVRRARRNDSPNLWFGYHILLLGASVCLGLIIESCVLLRPL